MNQKQIINFLKPDWRKLLIFAIFVLLNVYLFYAEIETPSYNFWEGAGGCWNEEYGLPLAFYHTKLMPCPGGIAGFYIGNLVMDIIMGYLIACAVMFAYDRFRNKKKRTKSK